MKYQALAFIAALGSSSAFSAGLPKFLEGPVWGHLSSTKPLLEEISSHPSRQVYGSISNGILTFRSVILSDFELSETNGLVEYRTKTEALDLTLSFKEPFHGLYFITIRKPDGSYERYNLKMKKEK